MILNLNIACVFVLKIILHVCLQLAGSIKHIYHMAYGSGLMNVNFEGRKAIDQAPTSVKSVEVRDGGHTTQTDMASMYCSKCSAHVGWKIVRIVIPLLWILFFSMYNLKECMHFLQVKESNNHPIVHQGQYIVQNHIKM